MNKCGTQRDPLFETLIGKMSDVSLYIFHKFLFLDQALDLPCLIVLCCSGLKVLTDCRKFQSVINQELFALSFIIDTDHLIEVFKLKVLVIHFGATDKL